MTKPIQFSTNLLGYSALGTILFATVCTCLALGLPYWEIYDVTLGSLHTITNRGLWQYCINYESENSTLIDMCGDPVDTATGSVAAYIRSTRAMVILSLVLATGAAVCSFLIVFIMQMQRHFLMHIVTAGLSLTSGLFSMIALALYTARVRTDEYDLYVAVAFDVLSWLVSWTSAVFVVSMAYVKKNDEHM